MQLRQFKPGQVIYTKGDEAHDMYTLVQGDVFLYDNYKFPKIPKDIYYLDIDFNYAKNSIFISEAEKKDIINISNKIDSFLQVNNKINWLI